jgi:hypothetical protein
MMEKGRHSRESGNPGYLKEARLPEITRYFFERTHLDARLRGHDELRHSLSRGRERVGGENS